MRKILLGLAWGAACTLIGACSSSVVVRTDYGLERFDDLIATNSEMMGKQPKREGNALQIEYVIIIKNTSKDRKYTLDLRQAKFDVNGEMAELSCKPYHGDKVDRLEVASKAGVRLDCDIRLRPSEKNKLAMRDNEGSLSIPYSASGIRGAIQYRYKLKIEDFE